MILHADNHRSQNTQYGKQWKNNPWPSWSLARRTNRAYQTFKQYTRSFPTRSQANISGWTRNTLSFERERLALSPRQATSIWRFMYVWIEGGLSDAAPLSLTDYSSGTTNMVAIMRGFLTSPRKWQRFVHSLSWEIWGVAGKDRRVEHEKDWERIICGKPSTSFTRLELTLNSMFVKLFIKMLSKMSQWGCSLWWGSNWNASSKAPVFVHLSIYWQMQKVAPDSPPTSFIPNFETRQNE